MSLADIESLLSSEKSRADSEIVTVDSLDDLDALERSLVGKTAPASLVKAQFKDLDQAERPEAGKALGLFTHHVSMLLGARRDELAAVAAAERIAQDRIDVTMPARPRPLGCYPARPDQYRLRPRPDERDLRRARLDRRGSDPRRPRSRGPRPAARRRRLRRSAAAHRSELARPSARTPRARFAERLAPQGAGRFVFRPLCRSAGQRRGGNESVLAPSPACRRIVTRAG